MNLINKKKVFFLIGIVLFVIATVLTLRPVKYAPPIYIGLTGSVSVVALNFTGRNMGFKIDDWDGDKIIFRGDGRYDSTSEICCFEQREDQITIEWKYLHSFSDRPEFMEEMSNHTFKQTLNIPIINDEKPWEIPTKFLYIWFFDDGKVAMKYAYAFAPVDFWGKTKPILYGDGWSKNFDGNTP